MGVFTVEIEVGDPQATSFEPVEALVDAGATYTVLPETLLGRLGVTPYSKSTFELADGSRTDLDVGRTWVKLNGQQEFTQVVFGADAGGAILGAITFEEMGLAVDPVGRRLVPVTKLLKRAR
jgi:clan AA aspartic protease